MNKIITLLTLSILSFGINASAVAIYTCDLEEGKTIDEAFFGVGADMPISAWSQRMRLVKQMFSN